MESIEKPDVFDTVQQIFIQHFCFNFFFFLKKIISDKIRVCAVFGAFKYFLTKIFQD